MIIKCKIFTTEKTDWFKADFPYIIANLKQARGVTDVTIDIEHIHIDTIPTFVENGNTLPDWEWFRKTFTLKAPGYNAVVLHMNRRDRERLGVYGVKGLYRPDSDDIFECMVSADKDELSDWYKEEGMSEFSRVFIHELGGHGFEMFTYGYTSDLTHQFDYGPGGVNKRCHWLLPKLTAIMDFTVWDDLKAKRDALIVERDRLLAEIKTNCMYPLEASYFRLSKISQAFGIPDSGLHSGIHNGVDFLTPFGTPIYAPVGGFITEVHHDNPTMGNAVFYQCTVDGVQYWMRFLHLSDMMPVGAYNKGDILGHTGSTGNSTGPHLHLDLWTCAPDSSLIMTADGVHQHMLDPLAFWRQKVDGITS